MARAPEPATLATGTVVADRFEIGRVLGPGVAGMVYAARDRKSTRDVALEVLTAPWVVNEAARQRFITELTIARSLAHANIVRVHDVGATPECVYLSMELLKGRSLRRRLTAGAAAQIPLQEVHDIARQAIDALQHAQRIIVHRDLRPDNLWLSEDGTVKVMGFGIARALLGAEPDARREPDQAQYLAPEQRVAAKDAAKDVTTNVDWRADQYSLAVVLHELLTGALPTAPTSVESLRAARPDVPPRFAAAVVRALSPNPEDRWPDWTALLAELQVPKPARWRVAAIAAIGIVVAAGSGFYFLDRESLPMPPPSKEAVPPVATASIGAAPRVSPTEESSGNTPASAQPAQKPGEATGEGAPARSPEQLARGQEIFAMACVACHGTGAAGAPVLGDKAAWEPRIASGSAVLYERALQGYQGQGGFMPPKGGRIDLDDQQVIDAVEYMVESSK